MEIALCNEISTRGGGLGILAGDSVCSGADLELPLDVVSFVYRRPGDVDYRDEGRISASLSFWR